jgi:hypothetical protein
MSALLTAVVALLEALVEKEGPAVIDALADWANGKRAAAKRVEDVLPDQGESAKAAAALGG